MRLLKHLPAMSIAVGLTVGPAVGAAWAGVAAPQEQRPAAQEQRPAQQQAERPGEELLLNDQLTQAQEWIDKPILDEQDQEVGQLEDLAIDVTNGRVAYAIIRFDENNAIFDFGNPQGQQRQQQAADPAAEDPAAERDLGDGLYAVPWEAFEPDLEHEGLTLTIGLEQFDPAQSFEEGEEPDMTDEQWARQTHERYGFQVYWEEEEAAPQQRDQQREQQRGQQMMMQREQRHQQDQQLQQREQVERADVGAEQHRDQIEQALEQAGADQQQARQQAEELSQRIEQEQLDQQQIEQELRQALQDAGADEQQAEQQASQLAQQIGVEDRPQQQPMVQQQRQQPVDEEVVHRDERPEHVKLLDGLIGENVNDPQDESLAELEDLVIDLREGRVPYALLSYGGILGIGVDHVVVPWQALDFDAEEEVFVLDATEDMLDQFAFDPDDWPDFTDEQWAAQLHTEFGQEPYWEVYGYAAPGEPEEEREMPQRQQPHEDGVEQIEQSLREHMEEAGVEPQQAQQEAQRLAQQFQQERPDEQQLTEQIQQALEQAGVEPQQAQQRAQQAGQEISQQLEQIDEQPEQQPLAPEPFEGEQY